VTGTHSAEERWRHAWAAFVLGAIAVVALGLIAFVLTSSRPPAHSAAPPMLLTEIPSQTSSSQGASTPPPSTGTSSRPSTAPSATGASVAVVERHSSAAAPTSAPSAVVSRPAQPIAAPRPAAPCRTDEPCVVGGDAAVAAALTAYRNGHGRPGAVHAAVSPAAQQCALTAGDGPTCAGPFAVARVADRSGESVIREIGTGVGNWLLDPKLTGVEIGWAYDPSSGQYVCVLMERT
jgi:hypothetical protein